MDYKITPTRGLEIVGIGHPDKIADWVSGLCVDFVKSIDRDGRAAFETLVKDQTFCISGEYRISGIEEIVNGFERDLIVFLNYKLKDVGFTDPGFILKLKRQAIEISAGVDTGGAGDQGVIYNYATTHKDHVWPVVKYLERIKEIQESISDKTEKGKPILYIPNSKKIKTAGWDFKAMVNYNALYQNFIGATHVTIALQSKLKDAESIVRSFSDGMTLPKSLLFNAAGSFEIGGTIADAGATNRKLAVDTTYGLAPNGGGGLHGKDLTKVDVSATYYLRYVAIQLAEFIRHIKPAQDHEIIVGVSYAIGHKEVTGLEVRLDGKPSELLTFLARENFDFSPDNMRTKWEIKSYAELAQTNGNTDKRYPWNKYDEQKVSEISSMHYCIKRLFNELEK